MNEHLFHLSWSTDLTSKEIWPDGAPEKPTAEDVAEVICKAGGALRVLEQWNLVSEIEIDCYTGSSHAVVKA